MSHLKKYPTNADVRMLVTDEWLDAKVAEVPEYNKTVTLATYGGDVTPDLLMAWAQFTHTILSIHPDSEISRDFQIKRNLSRDELEDDILTREASRRYYHPDEYPEYTNEDIAEL